jgi:uncharacterized membrane protein YhhN
MLLTAAFSGLAVAALLVAEWRDARVAVWLAKPLASLGFVVGAVLSGALDSAYGRSILLGLCLCALGDVLLIPRANGKPFLFGIASFALGHAAYAYAFYARGLRPWPSLIVFAAMLAIVGFVLRWLSARLPADMRVPVRVYMGVIASMVAFAIGASIATGDLRIGIGALVFAASDLSVARERFVQPSLANLLWGLPLYYAAQWLLAWSCAISATRV